MTCIVANVHNGTVYMGADSASSNRYSTNTALSKKLFTNSGYLIGVCGSWRIMQLLQYSLLPPKRFPDTDLMNFMVNDFIDATRSAFKTGGCMTRDSEGADAFPGEFLIGHQGRIFKVQCDYSVLEYADGYGATGSGEEFALGSLHTSVLTGDPDALRKALEAAACYSTSVAGPFHFESLPSK